MKTTKVKDYTIFELDDFKEHLKIYSGDTSNDIILNTLIKVSVTDAENYLDEDIAPSTCTMKLYDYSGKDIIIPSMNVNGIDSISGSTIGVISSDDYTVKFYESFTYIELDSTVSNIDTLIITYQSGYTIDELPAAIYQAIKIKVAELFDIDRSNYINSNYRETNIYHKLLNPYKRIF